MDYRKFGNTIYIRMDKGNEIISCILNICKEKQIPSAAFTGIGGCGEAQGLALHSGLPGYPMVRNFGR